MLHKYRSPHNFRNTGEYLAVPRRLRVLCETKTPTDSKPESTRTPNILRCRRRKLRLWPLSKETGVPWELSHQQLWFLTLFANVIRGCDFGYIHVEAIKNRLAIVERNDGSTVTLRRQPSKSSTDVVLSEEELFSTKNSRSSQITKATKQSHLKPDNETWTEGCTNLERTIFLDH